MSVYFVSLGCPKNLVDSEVMLGLLHEKKHVLTNNPHDAEIIIINTCSFIQASKEESIETILELAQLKETGKCKTLVVTGCLPQRYSSQLEKEMPEVDLFIGTGQYHKIVEIIETHKTTMTTGTHLPHRAYVNQPAFIHSEKHARVHTGPTYTAYLKIAEGCNRRCSFCIIPKIRGNVRSRSVDSLLKEASAMANLGVRELNLIAQDLTEYGMEWKYRERLETLLRPLAKINGIEWLRLHYVYPDELSDELIDIIAEEPKIVKYLDIPIQHTSNKILKAMNRRLTKDKLFNVVEKCRTAIPEIVFRTSVIVGFPGETDTDFEELCYDLSVLRLNHVGVFSYSREEGTPAAMMADQIHPSTKRKRLIKLERLLEEFSLDNNKKYLGKDVQVLNEGRSDETNLIIKGRMPTQAPEIDGQVLINDLGELEASALKPGDMVTVKITDIMPHDLLGTLTSLDYKRGDLVGSR
ncbi:MAG: 30S ribosomal protein S12 methylthiotransferase RimO [Bdellovibrionota bacterium]